MVTPSPLQLQLETLLVEDTHATVHAMAEAIATMLDVMSDIRTPMAGAAMAAQSALERLLVQLKAGEGAPAMRGPDEGSLPPSTEPTAETHMLAAELRGAGYSISFRDDGWCVASLHEDVYPAQVAAVLEDGGFETGMYEVREIMGRTNQVIVRAIVG